MNHFAVFFALVIEVFSMNIHVKQMDKQPCSCRSPVLPVKSFDHDEEDEMRWRTTIEALWLILLCVLRFCFMNLEAISLLFVM